MKAQVVSGIGKGGKYVEVYADKIEKVVNLRPYPGTLNLKLSSSAPPLETMEIPAFGKFGAIELAPCTINGERAFIVFPKKGKRHEGILEVIAEKNIKALLSLEDGDYVDIQF